jgi:hypothetical protein
VIVSQFIEREEQNMAKRIKSPLRGATKFDLVVLRRLATASRDYEADIRDGLHVDFIVDHLNPMTRDLNLRNAFLKTLELSLQTQRKAKRRLRRSANSGDLLYTMYLGHLRVTDSKEYQLLMLRNEVQAMDARLRAVEQKTNTVAS